MSIMQLRKRHNTLIIQTYPAIQRLTVDSTSRLPEVLVASIQRFGEGIP